MRFFFDDALYDQPSTNTMSLQHSSFNNRSKTLSINSSSKFKYIEMQQTDSCLAADCYDDLLHFPTIDILKLIHKKHTTFYVCRLVSMYLFTVYIISYLPIYTIKIH